MSDQPSSLGRPAHAVVRVGANGQPSIESFRCDACGTAVPEASMACRKCGSRTAPAPFRAAETGRLYSWSIIARSYPGVAVPFVSAIVDLDGGPTLKGTLHGAAMEDLVAGLPVRVRFDDAGGAKTADGAPFVGFHFEPAGGTAA